MSQLDSKGSIVITVILMKTLHLSVMLIMHACKTGFVLNDICLLLIKKVD